MFDNFTAEKQHLKISDAAYYPLIMHKSRVQEATNPPHKQFSPIPSCKLREYPTEKNNK